MYEIPSNPKIEKCIITKETVQDSKKPTVIINENKEEKNEKKELKKVKTNKASA